MITELRSIVVTELNSWDSVTDISMASATNTFSPSLLSFSPLSLPSVAYTYVVKKVDVVVGLHI